MSYSEPRNPTIQDEKVERQLRGKWDTDEALRAEFGNDYARCSAYFKANARGAARHVNATVQTFAPGDRFKPGAQEDGGQSGKLSGDLTPQAEYARARPVRGAIGAPALTSEERKEFNRRRAAQRLEGITPTNYYEGP